ncbi:MAG: hypothetical protein CL609_12870 [Anaerolineaceae bacterium]|nr:hypothetical protein [Anaerolineaceae bacterium]
MSGFVKTLPLIIQDVKNFGVFQSGAYLVYQLFKKVGLYHLLTPTKPAFSSTTKVEISPFIFPDKTALKKVSDQDSIKTVAERILKGEFLAFGMTWSPLEFVGTDASLHWSKSKLIDSVDDIKKIWEPARFDWSLWLSKAYHLTGDVRYYQGFKKYVQDFMERNPVNSGLNWQSGQEIAIRLINLSISFSLFFKIIDSDLQFKEQLVFYLQEHAKRISPTLIYAYAQNNNHLVSEAVGLITASVFFKNHNSINRLKKTGVFWLNYCLQHQFDDQGMYLQHSTNYHRMVLDLLMWVRFLENQTGQIFIYQQNLKTINKASEWLYFNSDSLSGEMVNYGHNDGAYLFQFASSNYRDARPILQAICGGYHFSPFFESGLYDEKSYWLDFINTKRVSKPDKCPDFRLSHTKSWAVLRANHFTSRPGQADQNHVDLWFSGENVVCDAGTYSYNLPEPWHNSLVKTKIHNTVTVDGLDQMDQHGTFRWRNWSSGLIEHEFNKNTIVGKHDGYKRFGIIHSRQLTNNGENVWLVNDTITNKNSIIIPHNISIQWLIKDCEYQIVTQNHLIFSYNNFQLDLEIQCDQVPIDFGIIRAGICIYGDFQSDPNLGWYSPSYLVKQPALSIIGKIRVQKNLINLRTILHFINC